MNLKREISALEEEVAIMQERGAVTGYEMSGAGTMDEEVAIMQERGAVTL